MREALKTFLEEEERKQNHLNCNKYQFVSAPIMRLIS